MPNVSIAEINRLRGIESKAQNKHEEELMQPFISLFTENVMLMIATTSPDQWPPFVKTAYTHAAGHYAHAAGLYRSRIKGL